MAAIKALLATKLSSKGQLVVPKSLRDQVFAMMGYEGPLVSIDQMDEGVLAEARRRK